MDEETLKRAANKAIDDAGVNCKVGKITKGPSTDSWFIQFTNDHGTFHYTDIMGADEEHATNFLTNFLRGTPPT